MRYCSECSSHRLVHRLPQGDTKERTVCDACGHIFYHNPKIVAGCILEWQGQILLCKRAIEPQAAYWTVPAGFLENGESVVVAAAREAKEEACAEGEALVIYSLYNLRHVNQVYIIYRGTLKDGRHAIGHESSDTMLCSEDQIPWHRIAFPVIEEALRLYCADRSRGRYHYHEGDIYRDEDKLIQITRY